LRGWLSAAQLDTYCADGTYLGVHPEYILPGIDFAAGSLGQGLAQGAGSALAARLHGSPRRIFVLLSDGECNEGSLWETVIFAAHHKMSNLIAIVDLNSQQALNYTNKVLNLEPMASRWHAFDWDVQECDGHDHAAISHSIEGLQTGSGRPHVILARTVFGSGVSFMERQIKWHYLPLTPEEYQQALAEVDAK
jgi:transketolase